MNDWETALDITLSFCCCADPTTGVKVEDDPVEHLSDEVWQSRVQCGEVDHSIFVNDTSGVVLEPRPMMTCDEFAIFCSSVFIRLENKRLCKVASQPKKGTLSEGAKQVRQVSKVTDMTNFR